MSRDKSREKGENEPAGEEARRETLLQRVRAARAQASRSRKSSGATAAGAVPALPADADAPLSPPQERLWLVERLRPGTPIFNITRVIHVDGPLAPGALEGAMAALAARHDALRTILVTAGDEPRQRLLPPDATPLSPLLPHVDLCRLEPDRRGLEADRLSRAQAHRPMPLGPAPAGDDAPLRRPPHRFCLLSLSATRHRLVLTFHHLFFDGQSLEVALRDLAALYAAAVEARSAALPPLPFRHLDHAAWARSRTEGEAGDADLEYWVRRLEGAPRALDLPTDHPRPRRPGLRGGRVGVALSRDADTELGRLAADRGASHFTVLLAAWAAFLSRITGDRRLVVGVPSSYRADGGAEDHVGLFVQTLPVVLDVDPRLTGGDLVALAADALDQATAHPRLSVHRLLETLPGPRSVGHSPLFQTLVSFHGATTPPPLPPPGGGATEGAALRVETVVKPAAELDLSLLVTPGDEGQDALLLYDAELFEAATVERFAASWARLLEHLVRHPDTPVAELPLLSDEQEHRLLVEWNRTPDRHPQGATVPQLVAEAARRDPHAVAVVDGGREHSYGELMAASGALARRLAELGVGLETRVALAAERSWQAVVAMLGTLRAGAAFVPLDLDYPGSRLALMLEDSGVDLVLASGRRAAGMDLAGHRRLDLDALLAEAPADAGGGEAAAPEAGGPAPPEGLAYVMYTSGSTGRPKGVAVPHRAIVRLVRGGGFADLGPDQTFLQLAPLAFDAATLEVWGALANGGRLVIAPPGPLSLADLGRTISASGATTLWLTAGLFHQMVDAELGSLAGVRQLLAGGDVLSVSHVRRVLAELPDCRLINGYGPTENTTFTCCCDLRGVEVTTSAPVGRPISGTRVYVLDAALRPVPVGVAGELWAAGEGLARGYLDRPALTAHRFLPDPFAGGEAGGAPGDRMYRTGDLARWRADGRVEFLGRGDGQVKLRGFRLELGEIEAALGDLPEVRRAVVVARGEGEAKELVAYVVPAPDAGDPATLPRRLGQALAQRLPGYMVPRHLLILAELPLGPNGKVDRRALPRPGATTAADAHAGDDADAGPPGEADDTDDVETVLAEIWCQTLGVPAVAPDDDFFQLGGHSLHATRILNRVARRFGTDVPLGDFFSAPTVADLAAELRLRGARPDSPAASGGAPADDPRPFAVEHSGSLPAGFGQRRLWLLERLHPGRSTYVLTAAALGLEGSLEPASLARSLTALFARHEALRTRLVESGGEPVQVIDPPSPHRPARVDLAALPVEPRRRETDRLVALEATVPFELAAGLARTRLIRRGDEDHAFLFTLHHAVADGGSLELLAADLAALHAGEAPPPPPLQASDVTVWQRRRLESPAGRADVSWWRRYLEGAPPLLELPTDRPRRAGGEDRGGRLRSLRSDLLPRLGELAVDHGATPFATHLATFVALLSRITGQRDLLVGIPLSARSRPELQGVVGFLVETVPVRVQVGDDPTLGRLVERLHRAVLEVQEHDRVPFHTLVEEMVEHRPPGSMPLVQAIFTSGGQRQPDWRLDGLRVRPLRVAETTAKFDLGLDVTAGGGDAGGAVTLTYRHALFDRSTAEEVLGAWEALVEAALASPDTALSRLPLGAGATLGQRSPGVNWNAPWGDRRRDPAGEAEPAATSGGAVPHEVYAAVAETWGEVLGLDAVPADGDFFALGGHSLDATRAIARLRDRLDVDLPLSDLFESPTATGFAARVAAALGAGGVTTRATPAPAPGRGGEAGGPAPLSSAQQRLWFLEQLVEAERSLYAIPVLLHLEGAVDVAALDRALVEIVTRHEVLRSRFETRDGRPVQVPEPPSRARRFTFGAAARRLPVIDLAALPGEGDAGACARAMDRLVRLWSRRPFDLEAGPLLHVALVLQGPACHRLLLSLHHIVYDGSSADRFNRELTALYHAFAAGRPSPLPPLPVQYSDFARWQRRRLDDGRLDHERDFWRRVLKGVEPLELPLDRPRPAVQGLRGEMRRHHLPAATGRALAATARDLGTTPFPIVMAAYQALLLHLTGKTDLCVGFPVAGRERPEDEDLIGYFSNTLVLRGDLSGGPTFAEVVERVRSAYLAALDHSRLPFDEVVRAVRPERTTDQAPLFQALLAYREVESYDAGEEPWLRVQGLPSSATAYDLAIGFARQGDDLSYYVEWDPDLFDATTTERWSGSLERLLTAALDEPATPVEDLPLLSPAQVHQLRHEWSGWKTRRLGRQLLPAAAIAPWVRRRPEATALVCGDEELTFSELWRRVGHLADALERAGVGPEVRVAVDLELSTGWAVSCLAIMAVGGAYVPLDAGAPARRRRRVLEDSGAALVLTAPASAGPHRDDAADGADGPAGPPRLDVTDLARETAGRPHPGPREPAFLPRSATAYTIYTSGSTGVPKGVETCYGALAKHLESLARLYGFSPDDRVLQFSSPAFDVSIGQLLAPLTAGAMVVVRDAPHWGLDDLNAAVQGRGVTMTDLPPGLWREWVADLEKDPDGRARIASLRFLTLGGESVPPSVVPRWYALAPPGNQLVDGYGPTEATITATTHPIPRNFDPARNRGVPIGSPLEGTLVHVVDPQGRLVAPGVVGELVIGGEHLARGYRNRPALTAASFVPHPWADRPGMRMYRTGDRVRRRADGVLQFLGRFDDQVQVRGFRVELGEVEAALAELPGVVESAAGVVSRDGTSAVVAWVATGEGPGTGADALRRRLADLLPDYMLPRELVVLDSLPRLASGKVDRRSLPEPGSGTDRGGTSARPRGEMERRVEEVWKQVLNVPSVGREDNFFDVGGHSLLLIRMHRKLGEVTSADLSLVDLFRHPTVASLAAHLEEAEGGRAVRPTPAPTVHRRIATAAGDDGAVAVVGLACRFPGAPDPPSLWRNLADGVESIRRFGHDELLAAGLAEERVADPAFVPAGGALEDSDLFDAPFFGMAAREAEVADPQLRVFLEVAWQALEDAGLDPSRPGGAVGIFAGIGISRYLLRNLMSRPDLLRSAGMLQAMIGNDKDNLPTQVAYRLDLRGPAVGVQTSCSTSLVAVHVARRALQAGDCDAALVGGATLAVPPLDGYLYEAGGILSPDGHCRAFDADARGTVPGSGAGAVVLKRLADARADGDTVRAVIRGSAINNDGSVKVGYTAPGVDGQVAVLTAALDDARVSPDSVSYVEAHGTGTPLGDPIEIAALDAVYGRRAPDRPLYVGSLKSNIGHLDTAAGVAGLVKAVLALEHGELPPSLHFRSPNPKLELDRRPIRVVDRLRPWESDGPRRAGVSSFGIGGTNAHVVLEEAPAPEAAAPREETAGPHLLLLSALDEKALAESLERLGRHLAEHPDVEMADVAHTLRMGRRAFAHRAYAVCADRAAAVATLLGTSPPAPRGEAGVARREIVFLLPGQGVGIAGTATGLYRHRPTFARHVDRGAELLSPRLGVDLRHLLFPPADATDEAAERLAATDLAQPALFLCEYALARLWMERGVEPAALLGHSLGELTAAALAGVFSFEDACTVVAERGRLMAAMPPGAMLAVRLDGDELASALAGSEGRGLALAAANAPGSSVVSGPAGAVATFADELEARGVEHRSLRVRHAFHSSLMDGCLEDFHRVLAGIDLRAPRLPVLSNRTGGELDAARATDPAYWVGQLRHTVRFADAAAGALEDPARLFLEVGPGRTLGGLLRRQPGGTASLAIPTLPGGDAEAAGEGGLSGDLEAAGRLWLAGAELDLASFSAPGRRRVPLPTYPFQRRRYWIEAGGERGGSASADDGQGQAAQGTTTAGPAQGAGDGHGEGPGGGGGGHPRPALPTPYVAPADDLQRTVAAVWGELLGIRRVGVHDDFFELGGDSLLAVRVMTRLHGETGVELEVGRLFAGPTVAGLSELYRQGEDRARADETALAEALGEVASLSADEVEALLRSEDDTGGAADLATAGSGKGSDD